MIAGLTAGSRPAHVARAALEAIAWRVADVLAAMAEHGPIDVLRVDGGLTRNPLLLQLQADAAGVPGPARRRRRHRSGRRRALERWAAGVWESISEIAERVPTGERVEPRATRPGAPSSTRPGAPSSSGPPRSLVSPSRAPAYGNMLAP